MGHCLLLSATVLTLLTISSLSGVRSASFEIVNNCRDTIWPVLSTSGRGQLPTTGFALKSGESKNVSILNSWTGRIWGRTHCVRDSSGKFTCLTGDCGTGELDCDGRGGELPVTLAEFALKVYEGVDYYDVSVVDGFNLPILVVAKGPSGACAASGCLVDLNGACPKVLSVAGGHGREGEVVGCRNACEPNALLDRATVASKCKPKLYSQFFKSACPRAYINPYDDRTAALTCASADYIVTFCPSPYIGKTTD